jgi:hypothetical protein
MEELKPCPAGHTDIEFCLSPVGKRKTFVSLICCECGWESPQVEIKNSEFEAKKEAVSAWNTRANIV